MYNAKLPFYVIFRKFCNFLKAALLGTSAQCAVDSNDSAFHDIV